MPEKKATDLRFRLTKYSIDQFAVFEENAPADFSHLKVSSEVKFEFQSEDYILKCNCSAIFRNGDLIVASAMVTLDYQLNPSDVDALIDQDSNTLLLSRNILALIASKTYGTLRGVLMAKLEPSRLRLVLPLLDMTHIITESKSVPLA